jgi:hypothetical protein
MTLRRYAPLASSRGTVICDDCGGPKRRRSSVCRTCYLAKPLTLPVAERLWSRVDFSLGRAGCWVWIGRRDRHGYGLLRALGNRFAHRVAYVVAVGPIPAGLSVLHRCDNPPCVNPAHLWLGTQADNLRDMVGKRRSGSRPERLSDAQVAEIRSRTPRPGIRQQDLADEFGVSRRLVGMILRGERRSRVNE